MEICFMIVFSILLLFLDIEIICKTKRTIDIYASVVQGAYLVIIFILWILYCLFHLNIL